MTHVAIPRKEGRLVICLPWASDCLFLGRRDVVISAADEIKVYFECNDVGFTDKYVGCKINMNKNKGTVPFKQPVLMKSLIDEFGVEKGFIRIPVTLGTVLQAGKVQDELKGKDKKKYQAGVGRLLNLAR